MPVVTGFELVPCRIVALIEPGSRAAPELVGVKASVAWYVPAPAEGRDTLLDSTKRRGSEQSCTRTPEF
jgi:hypothetical protein